MEQLIIVIITWLTSNYDLEYPSNLPRIEQNHSQELSRQWVQRVIEEHSLDKDPPAILKIPSIGNVDIVAFYDDTLRTIFLDRDWDPRSPGDQSILVHELVHHLQREDALSHACLAERERLAYEAQAKWLAMYNMTLESAFGIDDFTLLVRTKCMPH